MKSLLHHQIKTFPHTTLVAGYSHLEWFEELEKKKKEEFLSNCASVGFAGECYRGQS